MLKKHGELYWRRDHQIPTVLVCPTHGSVLRIAATSTILKTHFCPATAETCPGTAALVLAGMTDRERDTLHAIAVRSAALLQRNATIVSKATCAEAYRRAMVARGLMHGVQTNAQALRQALLAEFGHLQRVWPEIFEKTGVRGSGALERIAGASAEITDPLVHILLAMLLDRLPDLQLLKPFGAAPRACPNPLASHASELPVQEALFKFRHTPRIIGHFSCKCGYTYTRTAHPDGRVTVPHIKSFGPTLHPLRIEAIANGWARRRTAMAAGISPRTLISQAAALGLSHPWPKGRDWRADRRKRQSSPMEC